MKEIRETKLVEQTTVKYIAYNGKEFDKEIDCKVYEADQHRRDTEVELKAIMTNIEVPCLEWMGYAVYKITARNEEDIIKLYSYFNEDWYSFGEYEEFFELGKTVYIFVNDDGYVTFYKRDLEDELKNYGKKKTEKKTDK